MNRTTKAIFKFLYKHPTGISLRILYNKFPNKTAVDQSYQILIEKKLIVNRNGLIELTVDGYDYYYNIRKNLFLNIFKTAVIPLLITIISSYITAKIIKGENTTNNYYICEENYNVDK